MKKLLALLLTACLVAAIPISCFAEDTEDYSYLEDMSVKELKALREAINNILGDEDGNSKEDADDDAVEGAYYSIGFSDSSMGSVEFTPDNEAKTMGSCIYSIPLLDPKVYDYRITGDHILFDDNDYQIHGNYLIPHTYDYDGTIPDGDTFDAEVRHTSSIDGSEFVMKFKKDGTYESYTVGKEKEKTTGTYSRDGDIIAEKRDDYDPNDMYDALFGDTNYALVYDGIYNPSAYEKAS